MNAFASAVLILMQNPKYALLQHSSSEPDTRTSQTLHIFYIMIHI
uniref:Uncharacterized protein n=1 Tax=Anguilla anguilla TaxID=7936 RepID=A0A0E9VL67_ANGAN